MTDIINIGKLKLIDAMDVQETGIFLVFYGVPGCGKSWLATQMIKSQYGMPLLLCDAEAGKIVVKGMKGVKIAPIHDSKTFETLTEDLYDMADTPFKAVIIDNGSEIFKMCVRRASNNADTPQIQHYLTAQNQFLKYTRVWRQYAEDRNVVVIMTLWASPEKEESTGIIKQDVGFSPALQKDFPGLVDIVGHLTVDSSGLRCLSFANGPRTAAKFRTSKEGIDIPLNIYYTINQNPLVDIINTLKTGAKFPQNVYVKKREN